MKRGGHLMMSEKEREHLRVCVRVKEGGMKLSEGANQARLSYRQMLRVYDCFRHEGDARLRKNIDEGHAYII